MKKLKVYESVCACEKCSSMCQAPCVGTPAEMRALIKKGFGSRLMVDEWPDGERMLKPALKEHESCKAPWETASHEGCTFWKDGLCELHDLGLKPLGARIARHDQKKEVYEEFRTIIERKWSTEASSKLVEKWKENYLKKYDYEDMDDEIDRMLLDLEMSLSESNVLANYL